MGRWGVGALDGGGATGKVEGKIRLAGRGSGVAEGSCVM